jgi:hypothetical protein
MTWLNKNNEKYIYMLNLNVITNLSQIVVNTNAITEVEAYKTKKALMVAVNKNMSTVTIIFGDIEDKRPLQLTEVDIIYINVVSNQFAFIVKSKTLKNESRLVTNDKQLMMNIVKKSFKSKYDVADKYKNYNIKRKSICQDTYNNLYNQYIEKLYQTYKNINAKIKYL